jgi:hypothetical protein
VAAFRAYERPRRPDGALFRRKPTEDEMQAIRKVALDSLDRAVAAAEAADLADPCFRDLRARLRHEAARTPNDPESARLLEGAAQDWAHLRAMAEDDSVALTEWERALIYLLSAAAEAARPGAARDEVERLRRTGADALERVARERFGDAGPHQDIKTWRKVAAAIDADGPDAALPEIDFVTVE